MQNFWKRIIEDNQERGWELLWLATGLFPPSKNLVKDLALFQVPLLRFYFNHMLRKLLDFLIFQSLLFSDPTRTRWVQIPSWDWRRLSKLDKGSSLLIRLAIIMTMMVMTIGDNWMVTGLPGCYINVTFCYIFAPHFLLSLLFPDQSNSHWTPSFPQSIKTRIRNNFQRN